MTTAVSPTTVQARELDCIERARRGDSAAFGELVSCYRVGVVGVVYRMSGDPLLAEEAAQEAFLRAWQHLHSYDPHRPFRAWIYRIAINAALDALRQEKSSGRQGALALDGLDEETNPFQGPDSPAGPEETLEGRERARRVRRAVLGLPPASRSVLVLREYGGLSYTEIAGTLGIPLGTVMSRLNSSRAQLRQSLAGLLEE